LFDASALALARVLFGSPDRRNCGDLAQLSGITILKEIPP
jgi:hypothetical protein